MDFYDSRYFNINKTMLRCMGLWPYQSRRKKFLLRFLFSLLMLISMIPQIIALRKYKENFEKVIQSLATCLYVSGIYLKLFTAIIGEKKIKTVYETILDNWKVLEDKNEKKLLMEYSETGRFLTIGYAAYMFSALIFFITMPALPKIMDIIIPLNESRPAIYILDGEYIGDKHENYGRIYIFEMCVCVLTVFTFCTIDSTYAVCVEQCIGLMAVVKLRLKLATKNAGKIQPIGGKDKAYKAIVQSVELHKIVINFASTLESSYSMSFLIIIGVNVTIISVGSIVIIVNLNRPMELLRYCMIFVGLMMHMFYISWPGQKLIDSSGGIFQDAYNNEWYMCSPKTQKLLKFMMLRCMEPCQLTAGGIYVMNIINCGSLAKTAVSYIAVFASFR